MSASLRNAWQVLFLAALLVVLAPPAARAALINFENCLDSSIVNSSPLRLQWIPLHFDAKFDHTHNLNVTIYGNVSGQTRVGDYPPADSPDWTNETITFGKIEDIGTSGSYSTLFAGFDVLSYSAWSADPRRFCPTLIDGKCPLGPAFYANASDLSELPAFSLAHDFGSSYAFSTIASTIRVVSGDTGAPTLACVKANVVPNLGPRVKALLTWLPAGVLTLKGLATLSAAIWAPWGSTDIFKWSSNYGRDEDLLRLVTPGFGDCLQYIQFVALTGALSLQYPGFYQPAVSQVAWSTLLFNESYVSQGNGTQSLVDGIYSYNSTYGMTAMSQLIGMTETQDVWACMAIWLLVIAGGVVLLCQLGFLGRWLYRTMTKTTEEDLRQKNLPFTIGNLIRLLFNYFILPIVAISLYQLVIAGHSLAVVVAMAGLLLLIMLVSAGWIMRVIFRTKPRTMLFDDMPTVLMYGPLYNTYSDSAAPFALVPVFITFMRGVALGAIQPSGIAQIIVLAICEVILILTLNGFRPFQGQTSMNAYHTFFATVRLVTVLLSIAFVPNLGVVEGTKGWIGYVILFFHACVLVFGFFLNATQTLIEIVARAMGAAGDAQTGAIRGSILNLRMLKKRRDRPNRADRGSMTSNAAILRDSEAFAGGRSRSMSASSQQLLNQVIINGTPSMHRMSGFENFSSSGEPVTPGTNDDADGYTYLPRGKLSRDQERSETFYRPPRARRPTNDPLTPGTSARTRKNTASSEFPYQDSPENVASHARQVSVETGVAPAYFRDRQDSNPNDNSARTDYAVREVDQYYRGAALSEHPARKLKTGPADPVGPAASATTWLQRMLFGAKKKKEPSKGFEVVRSSRMPPGMQQQPDGAADEALELQTSPTMRQEPYRDSPPLHQDENQAGTGAERPASLLSEEESVGNVSAARPFSFGFDMGHSQSVRQSGQSTSDVTRGRRPDSEAIPYTLNAGGPVIASQPRDKHNEPRPSHETDGSRYDRPSSEYPDEDHVPYRISGPTPVLQPIEPVGDIELPSRFNSRRSANLKDMDISASAGGEDWLRAVDNLNWNHENSIQSSRTSSGAQVSRSAADSYNQPYVSPRSSLRQSVNYHQNGRNRDILSGFDSDVTPPGEDDPDLLGGASRTDSARRGHNQVSHHRAADSITRNSFGANAAMQAIAAEVFSETPPPPGEDYLGGAGGHRG